MENKKELFIGDYVTFSNLGEKVIYKVLKIEDLTQLTLKVIFPRELAKKLKEHNVFSLIVPFKNVEILGNPNNNISLRSLYG